MAAAIYTAWPPDAISSPCHGDVIASSGHDTPSIMSSLSGPLRPTKCAAGGHQLVCCSYVVHYCFLRGRISCASLKFWMLHPVVNLCGQHGPGKPPNPRRLVLCDCQLPVHKQALGACRSNLSGADPASRYSRHAAPGLPLQRRPPVAAHRTQAQDAGLSANARPGWGRQRGRSWGVGGTGPEAPDEGRLSCKAPQPNLHSVLHLHLPSHRGRAAP